LAKKPVQIEVVEEGDERFLLKTFDDGESAKEEKVAIAN
jgi:hypothetical protein